MAKKYNALRTSCKQLRIYFLGLANQYSIFLFFSSDIHLLLTNPSRLDFTFTFTRYMSSNDNILNPLVLFCFFCYNPATSNRQYLFHVCIKHNEKIWYGKIYFCLACTKPALEKLIALVVYQFWRTQTNLTMNSRDGIYVPVDVLWVYFCPLRPKICGFMF